MSRLQPGPDSTRARHGAILACPDQEPAPDSALGWCLPCYEHGAFTLASGPSDSTCVLHGEILAQGIPPTHLFARTSMDWVRRAPRGAAFRARSAGAASGPGRPGRPGRRGVRARARARAMAHGRERARRRMKQGCYAPHPGWRNFIATGHRVLTSQSEALSYLARRVDDEEWRSDKRRSWSLILRQLVRCMDWETGLIAGVTTERLGEAGGRAQRTVSRVLAWARDIGALVVVECGASAEFLGTESGRTPTYALVTTDPPPARSDATRPVDETGDLPTTPVDIKPSLRGKRTNLTATTNWPAHAVPDNPHSRNAATLTLITRLGLDGRQAGKIKIWRARALLKRWWDAGACVAGLLYAAEFHPDRRDVSRGDVARGVNDPIAVLGARLRPWQGRLNELPAHVTGHRMHLAPPSKPTPPAAATAAIAQAVAEPAARAMAREALRQHLDELREKRRAQHPNTQQPAMLPVPSRAYGRSPR